ncbi:MAG: helix-hairpin-helix domain-containing protein, partial [Candidatus Cloacimonadota bacterium]|nr:helix-hairpin-helix domain-containing protein [Candidatus Cloacimonadota bacterium]
MKKIIIFSFIVLLFLPLFGLMKIDINKADLVELQQLPITPKQAHEIMEYRTYVSFFKSFYDLRNIVDQKTLLKLKPLVIVSHHDDKDETAKRRKEVYYLIRRFGNEEGSQEGMTDVWEDYLLTPKNINKIFYSDLLSMPNMTPVGAAAIVIRKNKGEIIKDYRSLRHTLNLTHYEATNLKNFVSYKKGATPNRLYVDYQFRYNDSPYEEDVRDMFTESMIKEDDGGNSQSPRIKSGTYWGYFDMDKPLFSSTNKLRLRYNNEYKAGILFHNSKGSPTVLDGEFNFGADSKIFAGYENFVTDNIAIKGYLGNYRATFGEGLVMENTDVYSSRKTGFGFTKRITGIIGDMSSTQEYALRGGAFEFKTPFLNAVLFGSSDKKDGIVYDSNNNGVFDDDDNLFSYVTMSRRFTNEELEDSEDFFTNYNENGFVSETSIDMAPRRDAFNERIIGTHLEVTPFIGTHLGFTGYEAVYDRDFVVSPDSLKYELTASDEDAEEKFKMMDSELNAMYSTKTEEYDRNFRRVLGFDWGTIIGNTAFQGEYARLIADKDANPFNKNPDALVLTSYSSFGNLYLLTLYRDYDLAFDNPYARGFSEHEKFDDTILDKNPHTLTNPLIADVYVNSAQAQAERGIYFETRYRFNR